MSVFQAFLKTAEDMSKEDIAANRAIGLYGVSFLQIHIKDSKSLRSLTHYNTRSLVTTAKFHLIHYNLLAYRISRGSIQLIDLRQSAVYDHKAEVLQHDESSGFKSFLQKFPSFLDFKIASDEKHQNFHPILRRMHVRQYA